MNIEVKKYTREREHEKSDKVLPLFCFWKYRGDVFGRSDSYYGLGACFFFTFTLDNKVVFVYI